MKYLLVIIALSLAGCGTTINNQYTVNGDRNTFRCDSVASPLKTVETSLGAAVSATAALSQAGPAQNSGESESTVEVAK